MKIRLTKSQKSLVLKIKKLYEALEDLEDIINIVGESNDGYKDTIKTRIRQCSIMLFEDINKRNWIDIEIEVIKE
jgi:hypothetical protein